MMKAFASTLDLVRAGRPAVKARRGALIDIRERSLPWSGIGRLAEKIGAGPAELLTVIGVAPRTALRRQKEGFLKPDEADRLLRVGRVFEDATRIFGSPEKAGAWLRIPSAPLSDATPLSLLESDAGTQIVMDELTRIDFGDFA